MFYSPPKDDSADEGKQAFLLGSISQLTLGAQIMDTLTQLHCHFTRSFFIVFSLFAISFTQPSTASATGYITPGSEWITADPAAKITTNEMVGVYFEKDRSYSCTVHGYQAGFDNAIVSPDSSIITATEAGKKTPHVAAIDAPADDRLILTAKQSGVHIISLSTSKAGGENVRAQCLETTLYGGYNTNVNDFNFLELNNTTNSGIKGKITATNADGTVVINKKSFSVPAGRRVDVDLHSAVGNNKFGMLVITHNGTFGALQGYVSQYRGTVSDFQLTVALPLKHREQQL